MLSVRKAVFPVAGFDTRFLPATKASPKEMLPVVDKPLIQYAVEEAVAAGITELIFVTGRGKQVIEDHFDESYEIEHVLKERGEHALLALIHGVKPDHVHCVYVRQSEPLGLGDAVLCTEKLIGDEPFAVILADDLIECQTPVLAQMIRVFSYYTCPVIAVEAFEPDRAGSYGVIDGTWQDERVLSVSNIDEKPSPAAARTGLGVVGRYILSPAIFRHLRALESGAPCKIELSDAIRSLLADEQVLAWQFEGTRFDCGTRLGYLAANVQFALGRADLQGDFYRWLRQRIDAFQLP